MTEPRRIDFSAPVDHDAGVHDREADVDGTRWAHVDYDPARGARSGARRRTRASC